MIMPFDFLPSSNSLKTSKKRKKKTGPDFASIYMDSDPSLLNLIRLRIAQIHECRRRGQELIKRMKAQGWKDRRLHQVNDWKKKALFSNREVAALSLAEALTCHSIGAVPDRVVRAASLFFTASEMMGLILVILEVNDWHYLGKFATAKKTQRPPHE